MKIDFLRKSKRFLGPMVDEVALHIAAVRNLAGISEIEKAITAAEPDLATCMLYNHFKQSRHKEFIQTVDGLPVEADPNPKGIKILIVPGLFYLEYPDVGADGRLMQEIFSKNGFNAEIVAVNSRGSVSENKYMVRDALARQMSKKVWLLSISKGSADVRACLQDIHAANFPLNLKGWINFSGTFSGSILSDHRTDTQVKRLFLRLVSMLAGVNPAVAGEMSSKSAYWLTEPAFAQRIELIHVLGFPLRSHIQPMLSHRFATLSKWGPTDGMIRLLDTLSYPGHIYPLWGCDHFARSSAISSLLYRLSHFISRSSAPERLT